MITGILSQYSFIIVNNVIDQQFERLMYIVISNIIVTVKNVQKDIIEMTIEH